MNNNPLVETLTGSKMYQDYERAFSDATGLPVTLRPVESWQLPLRGKRNENRFCALRAGTSRACAACLQMQQKLADSAQNESQTLTCAHGLCDTAVPVRAGDQVLGYLQTGQIFRKKPTQAQFERTAKLSADWGVEADREQLKQAYFSTRVLAPKQYDSMVKLLSLFAQHLSMVSN